MPVIEVKAVRKRLGLSQQAFEEYGFSVENGRNWEDTSAAQAVPPLYCCW